MLLDSVSARAPVPSLPSLARVCARNLRVGGAVVAFTADNELAGDLGGQGRIGAAEGAGRRAFARCAFFGALENDLQHVHRRNNTRMLARCQQVSLWYEAPICVRFATWDLARCRVHGEGRSGPAGPARGFCGKTAAGFGSPGREIAAPVPWTYGIVWMGAPATEPGCLCSVSEHGEAITRHRTNRRKNEWFAGLSSRRRQA